MRFGKLEKLAAPALLLGLPAAAVHADPLAFDVGPVLVRPQLGVAETYNDNVFLELSHTHADFITTVTPGIGLSVGRQDGNHGSILYQVPASFYSSDTILNYPAQVVTYEGAYNTSRMSFQGQGSFSRNYTILGGEAGLSYPVGTETFNDTLSIGYDVSPKTTVYGKGTYDSSVFDNNLPLIDYEDIREIGGVSYHYSPKTSIFVEGYTGQIFTHSESSAIPSGPRGRYYGGYLGMQGALGTRFTYNIKGGYELRDYADGTSAPNAITAEVGLTYNFNERTVATVTYRRANLTSVVYANSNYLQDQVSARLTQKFGAAEKLEASIGIVYYTNGYERFLAGREDNLITVDVAAKYHFNDWLTGSCGYQRLSYDSNFNVHTYVDNRIYVQMNLGYPMISR